MNYRNRLLCCTTAVSALAICSGAWAATATDTATATATETTESSSSIGAVVVVARKTSENLQRVPVAVTSQTGQQLSEAGITTPTELSRAVPSLFIRSSSSAANSAQIALRG